MEGIIPALWNQSAHGLAHAMNIAKDNAKGKEAAGQHERSGRQARTSIMSATISAMRTALTARVSLQDLPPSW
jgi:tryptophan synthase beta subunit